MDPEREKPVKIVSDEEGEYVDRAPVLGPWERLALGAQKELEKWTESRRNRRRTHPRRRLRDA